MKWVTATPINLSPSSVKSRVTSPLLCACPRDSSLTVRNPTNRRSNRLPWIKPAAASDSTAIADNPSLASTSDGEEIKAKIGIRLRPVTHVLARSLHPHPQPSILSLPIHPHTSSNPPLSPPSKPTSELNLASQIYKQKRKL
ncbi:hypothetical protein L1987_80165 [Smallanthus sonchifolius]|uniref:Uncharacterized protein n=1 Tax=Smallanthus sonchifolius TaxID=185202 RepID=A0ACB8YMJ3_9ASTR|nr:hypothetical protein L1987_80165 [Smallanthus sonchifolius]